jgi:hypothetical protein
MRSVVAERYARARSRASQSFAARAAGSSCTVLEPWLVVIPGCVMRVATASDIVA